MVLMYHRVARVPRDPWRMAVDPTRFAEQVEVLGRRRTIVPLDWLVTELEAGRVPLGAVALTFDDGYLDVLTEAKPVLERAGAPAVAYLTTGSLGRRREFWWDELARLLLEAATLPAALTLEVGGRTRTWRVPDGDAAGAEREAFHYAVWDAIRLLPAAARNTALAAIAAWAAAAPPARPADRALDPDEVRALAAGGVVAIGAHSVSHASLPALAADAARREIAESRAECERLVGAPVTGFAFPFGDWSRATARMARAAGFRHAVTVEPGYAVSARDRFQLPRMLVADWSGEELEQRLLGAR
jgi:peptidoglycan/xylan/chitin deacetylase (PgdA/CDA1 family)